MSDLELVLKDPSCADGDGPRRLEAWLEAYGLVHSHRTALIATLQALPSLVNESAHVSAHNGVAEACIVACLRALVVSADDSLALESAFVTAATQLARAHRARGGSSLDLAPGLERVVDEVLALGRRGLAPTLPRGASSVVCLRLQNRHLTTPASVSTARPLALTNLASTQTLTTTKRARRRALAAQQKPKRA
eukprot:CAMPEP_0171930792 /NCGR_PEP_ID=MMETSP0993-20121228/28945_1 /TAXON_ID=483369 /ORGANISM="non described non described, Strain CCMP2098" /LENGTH=192 /DNA_ID=CAMNT_0012570705 /DNA_START=170 /DNA_END=746 /DNA_ORIENTATION=+